MIMIAEGCYCPLNVWKRFRCIITTPTSLCSLIKNYSTDLSAGLYWASSEYWSSMRVSTLRAYPVNIPHRSQLRNNIDYWLNTFHMLGNILPAKYLFDSLVQFETLGYFASKTCFLSDWKIQFLVSILLHCFSSFYRCYYIMPHLHI